MNIHNTNASNGAAHLNTHHAGIGDWIAACKLKDESPIPTGDTKRAFNAMDHSLSINKLNQVHNNVMKFIVPGLPALMYAHPYLNKLLLSARTMQNSGQYKVVTKRKSKQVVIKFFQRFVDEVSADINHVRKL
jgi:hypothetical protein